VSDAWDDGRTVNVLSHAVVADRLRPHDAAFAFGATLPDLARFAGVRPDHGRLAPAVAAGVGCHHRTDDAFHAHPSFVAGSTAIREALAGDGLSRGAARAVGHVGWELLLDAALAATPANEAVLTDALEQSPALEASLDAEDVGRWRVWSDARRRRRSDRRFHEPAGIAERLQHLLASRPRLCFPAERCATVAARLTGHRAEVERVAPSVVDEVVAAVRRSGLVAVDPLVRRPGGG
jgi:hypothetical protein